MIHAHYVAGEKCYSTAEIEAGLKAAAKLVKRYGGAYMCYFLFLEKELAAAKDREAISDRINAILAE